MILRIPTSCRILRLFLCSPNYIMLSVNVNYKSIDIRLMVLVLINGSNRYELNICTE